MKKLVLAIIIAKTMFKFIFIFFFSVCSMDAYGQGAASGCLLPNGIVYTQPLAASNLYKRNGSTLTLSPDYCSWSPSNGPSCTVCNSLANITCFFDSGSDGVQGFFTMVQCPLDNSVAVLFGSAALVAYISIRKKH